MELHHYLKTLGLLVMILNNTVVYAADNIQVKGLFRDTAIVTINGKQSVLKRGKPTAEGIELIQADSRTATIKINGEEKKFKLGSHIDSSYKESKNEKKVIIAPDANGMYFTNGSINGFQVEFIVDTGATLISMNRNVAKRVGLNYKIDGTESFSRTASGISKIYILKLDKVRVGDIEIQDVDASVHDSEHPSVILLGNSFLSQLAIERKGKLLTLSK